MAPGHVVGITATATKVYAGKVAGCVDCSTYQQVAGKSIAIDNFYIAGCDVTYIADVIAVGIEILI